MQVGSELVIVCAKFIENVDYEESGRPFGHDKHRFERGLCSKGIFLRDTVA